MEFVLSLERDPENTPFIGRWSREEHAAAISRTDREHWVIEVGPAPRRVGFLIAYDVRARGLGVYVKRIVVCEKSQGLGRIALGSFVEHAFRDLATPFLWLSVYSENVRAQRCYSALGFRVASVGDVERKSYHDAVGGFSDRSLLMILRPQDGPS